MNTYQYRKKMQRVAIYAKDIEILTGRSEKAARNLFRRIRRFFGKKHDQFITFHEFCIYTGMDEDMLLDFLKR
jgi:hypothetical protein